jgi:hypothetical protein
VALLIGVQTGETRPTASIHDHEYAGVGFQELRKPIKQRRQSSLSVGTGNATNGTIYLQNGLIKDPAF